MSFGYPRRDIFVDAFRQYTNKSYLLLSDERLPVRIFPCPEPAEFYIYTTDKNDCGELGSTQYPFQRPVGFMCHGYTNKPVKVPYVGQKMFFWTVNARTSVFSGQSVIRVYDKPLLDLIPDIWGYLDELLSRLNFKVWEWNELNLTTLTPNEFDKFFKDVLMAAITKKRSPDLSLPVSVSKEILNSIPNYTTDDRPIFNSGLIHENEYSQVVVSEALIVTLMDAIQMARPMRTVFDTNGILRVA